MTCQLTTKPKKRKTPYWWVAIDKAKKFGFSDEEKDNAGSWITCACGKQDKRIPRKELGSPNDRKLANLGIRFCDEVDSDNPFKAEKTLLRIEHCAAIVIAQSRKGK